jgi:hypothetical protein
MRHFVTLAESQRAKYWNNGKVLDNTIVWCKYSYQTKFAVKMQICVWKG